VTVDNATKADDYDVVFDNCEALRECPGHIPLGGSEYVYTNTTYSDLEYPVHIKIDGTNQGGDFTYQIHFMGKVAAGTGYLKLYNITDTGDVAGSEKTFTNNTADRIESATITLASGVKEYKVMVKGAAATDLVQVWGIALVRS
jgi:hypothetical protein